MYNTIKFSIFLVAIILVGKIPVANAALDTTPIAGDMQTKHEKIDLAETKSQLNPVYLIVQHTVLDVESYTKLYAIHVGQQLQDIGAKILAVSSEPQVLEGKWEHKSTVIIRFPSMSVAKKFYSSEEYKPYRDIRINKLTEGGNLVLVPGYAH
ncbi:MAG: DUF1330 domain-containing protein [Alcanivoracaceae bacterium]|nr:DUF1330 domain-containing protein [Alcanivoracaceae bacterium]